MAESVSLSKCRLESIIANMCSKHFFLLHTKMFTFLVWNTTMGNKKGGFCWGFWQAINYTKVVNCWFWTPIRMHTVQVSEVHKQVLNYEHMKVILWYLTSLKTNVCTIAFPKKRLFGMVSLPSYLRHQNSTNRWKENFPDYYRHCHVWRKLQ